MCIYIYTLIVKINNHNKKKCNHSELQVKSPNLELLPGPIDNSRPDQWPPHHEWLGHALQGDV